MNHQPSSARPERPLIGVLDYGAGNRRSVEKALLRVGARVLVSADHTALRGADGLVLPGVGAFPAGMAALRSRGLDELLAERHAARVPLLGLCLGLQLLFEGSEELGGSEGLGLLAGSVRRLEAAGRRLPHIGWSVVTWQRESPLTVGLPDACAFYHVHSYAPVPADPTDVLGTAEHGTRFVSAVQRSTLAGVQFHPEKSSAHGLRLLANFARRCTAAQRSDVVAA